MTRSPAWVAALGLIEFVPYLGFGLLAGAVADRMNRKKIMVGCDVIAAFLLAAIPAAAALHLLGMAQVLIVALGIAMVYVWFDAANFGTLPALVEPVRTARRDQPHRLIRSGRAAVRADDRGRPADRHVAGVRPRVRLGVLPHLSAAAAVHPAALRAAAVRAGPAADPRGYRRGPAVPLASAGDPDADVLGLLRVPELGWRVRAARGLRQPRPSPDAAWTCGSGCCTAPGNSAACSPRSPSPR